MDTGTYITQQQNAPRYQGLLAAISWYYQRAKTVQGLQFTLSVVGAVVLAIGAQLVSGVDKWVALLALSIALLDSVLLERLQSSHRLKAARLQELFDTELLRIPWNSLRVDGRPGREEYVTAAGKYRARVKSTKHLEDWYPTSIANLPLPLARAICQRTNCWYDASVRVRFANTLYVLLGIIAIGLIWMGVSLDLSTSEMLLTIAAPLLPAAKWLMQEARKQYQAKHRLDKTKKAVELQWKELLAGAVGVEVSDTTVRTIQDLIFDGRAQNPTIFNWFYFVYRPRHEKEMNEAAEELVEEATSRLS